MKDTVDAWIAKKRMPAHKVGRLWKSQVGKINEWRGMAALERANEE
jgi:excisionase family DNA binding protein